MIALKRQLIQAWLSQCSKKNAYEFCSFVLFCLLCDFWSCCYLFVCFVVVVVVFHPPKFLENKDLTPMILAAPPNPMKLSIFSLRRGGTSTFSWNPLIFKCSGNTVSHFLVEWGLEIATSYALSSREWPIKSCHLQMPMFQTRGNRRK